MSKIRLIERDTTQPKKGDPSQIACRYKYQVLAPDKLFGKRIWQYFKTKTEARDYKLGLETKLQNEKLTLLGQDTHSCAVSFQKRSKNFSMSLRRTALPWVNAILNWYDASATVLSPASTNAIACADT